MAGFTLDYMMLTAAAVSWRSEADSITGAKESLEGTTTAGFGDGVAADIATLRQRWIDEVSAISRHVDGMADKLDDGLAAYQGLDEAAREAFDSWLRP